MAESTVWLTLRKLRALPRTDGAGSSWSIDFRPLPRSLPEQVDFAVVGGGFTGLAAAAWLRKLAPDKSVGVFEAEKIGAGASGNTGGMVLGESSAGDLPGLGDVLGGFRGTLDELGIECDLHLPGAWEIGRKGGWKDSPISWSDSGRLRVVNEVGEALRMRGNLSADWRERPIVLERPSMKAGKLMIFVLTNLEGRILWSSN